MALLTRPEEPLRMAGLGLLRVALGVVERAEVVDGGVELGRRVAARAQLSSLPDADCALARAVDSAK